MKVGANSCTDVTGFGLLGHALEMADGSNVTLKIYNDKVPIIDGTCELASMGIIPGGAYSNMGYVGDSVTFGENVSQEVQDIMFDPQTSGGLLISVDKEKANQLLKELELSPNEYALIGEVVERQKHSIIVE